MRRHVDPLRVDDVPGEPDGIATLDRGRECVRVEPARPEDRVDRAGEAVRLVRDHVQQRDVLVLVEHDVLATKRHRGAVDRRERRAELVRDGRDELGLQRVEGTLLRQIPERVDGAVHHRDASDGKPQLALADAERQRLRTRNCNRVEGDRHVLRDHLPTRNRLEGETVEDRRTG